MEYAIISELVRTHAFGLVVLEKVPDRPGVAAAIFRPLADAGINVGEIVQSVGRGQLTYLSFTVPRETVSQAHEVVLKSNPQLRTHTRVIPELTAFALYGSQFKTDPDVLARFTECFADSGVNIEALLTSSLRLLALTSVPDANPVQARLEDEFSIPCQELTALPR